MVKSRSPVKVAQARLSALPLEIHLNYDTSCAPASEMPEIIGANLRRLVRTRGVAGSPEPN